MAVKWAKNLPSFASLAFRDQVILLEESWSALFLLNAIQWCMPLDTSSCSLFSVSEHCSNIVSTDTKQDKMAQEIRSLYDTLCRFKSILVDPAEFACLKAIVLFRSEAKGLKDSTQIENLQDQAQVIFILNVIINEFDKCFQFNLGHALTTLPSSISRTSR